MRAHFDRAGQALEVNYGAGESIALRLDPHGPQPSFYAEGPATARPLRSGDFVGDVSAGGSCNAEVLEFAPHCHGTHTECVGHLTRERLLVQDFVDKRPALALLVSLRPESGGGRRGPVFTDRALRAALEAMEPLVTGPGHAEALVIRRWPPDLSAGRRDYDAEPGYPVLAEDAMRRLSALPLRHLLVDTPSLDPASDGGELRNHRIWWGLERGMPKEAHRDPAHRHRSVTEMIHVPAGLRDGPWWLHLELSPLLGDATPSRPVLYPVRLLGTGPETP